ncbi:MAG: AAA family ATPase, partial [Acidimicrobiales bacterium]|nr:AAA family ATPase [Acidimicrobiales bacterium]
MERTTDELISSPTPEQLVATSDRQVSHTDAITALVQQVSTVVLGDPHPIRLAAAAFASGGHVLFEDIPGVGKTLLAKSLAASLGGTFGRIQGTPDLLPSDLTGVTYLDEDSRDWIFRPGPLFNNVVLVDELNRATPRTQSALLEAMAEGHVTVDGTTHVLPDPFLVIATQNP